jgi:ribosomal protein S18 acetylase RimI-like enzyme
VITVDWPADADATLSFEVHRVLADVVASGGSVGWLHVPDESESAGWLEAELALVRAGRAGFCCVRADGRLEAVAVWARYSSPVLAQNAEVRKVMVHPDARGRGLARVLMSSIADGAQAAGVETLTLDTRGNNHAAHALYESLGWECYGVLPDFIAVGRDRFDQLLYRLPLRQPADLVRHGRQPTGPGASPRRPASPA